MSTFTSQVVPGGDVPLDALPGIASALASALAGSQWRRKVQRERESVCVCVCVRVCV